MDDLKELIKEFLPDEGPVTVPLEAQRLYEHLTETQPEMLESWLAESAPRFLALEIRSVLHSYRSLALSGATTRAFSETLDRAMDGDTTVEPNRAFTKHFDATNRRVVDEDNTYLPVAEMRGEHHLFVARGYRVQARTGMMLAAFHEAVAKKIGDECTVDVLDEEAYDKLLQSIIKKN